MLSPIMESLLTQGKPKLSKHTQSLEISLSCVNLLDLPLIINPKFTEIASPLHCLTQKSKQFLWTKECQNAEILQCSDTCRPLFDTHECIQVLLIIAQSQKGLKHVVAYISRHLTKSEMKG